MIELEEELFEKKCVETFGRTSSGVKYHFEDLSQRLENLERKRDEDNPIIGAAVAKLEGLTDELLASTDLNVQMVMNRTTEYIKAAKNKVKLLEGT